MEKSWNCFVIFLWEPCLLLPCRPPPCSNGPAFVFTCHILRFCAMSSDNWYSFMSPLMLSCHLFLGLYFLPFPCTCISNIFLVVSSPSFHHTWPYHLIYCSSVTIGFALECPIFLHDSVSLVMPRSLPNNSRIGEDIFMKVVFMLSKLNFVFKHVPISFR